MPLSPVFAREEKVPIIYPKDTAETIDRRMQWVKAARKEEKLVWWGTLNPRLKREIIVEFNKVYPFIKVDHWRGRGAELATKLEAQHASGRFDVDICLGGEPFNYPRWRKKGMLQPYTDIIPGIEKIDMRMYNVHGDWFVPGNNGVTPQYNTNLVSAEEAPKSWADLLDPKWKGQIGIPGSSIKHWANLAIADGGFGIEKAEDFLKKLRKQDIIWGRGYSATHTLLLAGEFKIQAHGYVYHAIQSQEKGAPVEWVPVDPVLITGSSLTMNSSAPHPNAARLFLEWLLSSKGLAVWEKVTYGGAAFPGSGTTISKALEGLNLVYRTEETVLKVVEYELVERFSKILGLAE